MQAELSLNRAKELGVWLHERTNGLHFPSSERVGMAGAILYLAQEHYDAIIVLLSARLYGSAFALARVLFEAYIRGKWLLSCASEDDLKEYMKGHCAGLDKLLEDIGDDLETGGAWLKKNQKVNRRHFNELTHGGASHVVRRISGGVIESVYPEEELCRLLDFSNEVAIRVAAELFGAAGQELLLKQLEEMATGLRKQG